MPLTIAQLQADLQTGKTRPTAIAAACLRAAEENAALNPFITLNAAAIRAAAQRLEALSPAQRPLYGVPIAIKDLIDTADQPTTGGAAFWRQRQPAADAEGVRHLRQAGALLFGKTNTHEIALGVTTVNPHYGVTRNPHAPDRIAGGSSGGSAAAVAAGIVPAALGTDTGGSIRIPAALCGVVGLKPTYGRVSTRGVIPLSWHLDHVGPLTADVRSAAQLLNILAGYDPADPASVDQPATDYEQSLAARVRGWRIALAKGSYIAAAQPEILAAVENAASVLSAVGAQIVPVEMNILKTAARANGLMTQADAAAFHQQRLQSHPEQFGKDVRRRLQSGAATPLADYIRARRIQTLLRRRLERFFRQFDLLLLPTTPITAPPIEGPDAVAQARLLTRFTAPFNLTGLPALSLPWGKDAAGLPIGIQLVAGPWQEGALLRAAHTLESHRA